MPDDEPWPGLRAGVDAVHRLVRRCLAEPGPAVSPDQAPPGTSPRPPVVVAVDGRSGSGKSTFANALIRELVGDPGGVTLLRLDDVYPGWHGLAAGIRTVQRDILPVLRTRRPARYRLWDWSTGAPGAEREVTPADVVVLEGCGAAVASGSAPGRGTRSRNASPAGRSVGRRAGDVVVWLHASPAVRRGRALARDGDAFAPWWDTWAEQEDDLHPARIRAAADVVLDTEHGGLTTRPVG